MSTFDYTEENLNAFYEKVGIKVDKVNEEYKLRKTEAGKAPKSAYYLISLNNGTDNRPMERLSAHI
ncbi:MAG: hypothetical protein C0473_00975 [Cyanobacteria bacterium DS3.002]|nr:hypothetical protein [Cyanobacteria bacterium DS3.002]MBA4049520.1 hypothetical protein [Cyanobacteria bacterium DS2.008]